MPPTLTYPGVYIEEVSSGVHTITGVATSITAFVGFALRGPANTPTLVQSFPEFERKFGGLWGQSTMSFAVLQFFLNGGRDAIIVRAVHTDGAGTAPDTTATLTIDTLELAAANEGSWGTRLRVRIDEDTRPVDPDIPGETDDTLFNLTVKDMATGVIESFPNVATAAEHPRFVQRIVNEQSNLIRVAAVTSPHPTPNDPVALGDDPFDPAETTSTAFGTDDGQDGTGHDELDLVPATPNGTGIYALDTADLFNLLVVTPLGRSDVLSEASRGNASGYCRDRRAFFITDPDPAWDEPADIAGGTVLDDFVDGMVRTNAGLYFPRVRMADPLLDGATDLFPPSGVIAGVMARTDATRGVWKAPAGQEATLVSVSELAVKLDDPANGQLNPIAVNCLRTFPGVGSVVWGARTLAGSDRLASEWKYIPVRRTALFLEESLYRGTQWVVFEPNDAPLWAQIRLNVGAFMNRLFRQGAFAGTTPREAYFVKCDGETTTQDDVNAGVVNIVVGFAPLKPAEFVVIKLQQMAGQTGAHDMVQFAVNPQRFDPYKNFKFRVKWDGRYVAGISKVGALKRTTEVVEHRDGGDPSTSRKSPGRTKYEAITLERGVTHDTEFESWANKVWNFGSGLGAEVSLRDFRKDLMIDVYNEAGQLVLAYRVYRAWVSEFQALPDLDANANAVAIQTIKLEHEGFERDYEVPEPSEPQFSEP